MKYSIGKTEVLSLLAVIGFIVLIADWAFGLMILTLVAILSIPSKKDSRNDDY